MAVLDEMIGSLLGPLALATLKKAPLPTAAGYEPDALALKRIELRLRQGRFDDLLRVEQEWVCGRLMPSLARYGCYPPPPQPPTLAEV